MANEDLLPNLVDADISNINPRDAITAAMIDRSAFAPQMTPDMRARLQTIVQGEVGHGATPEQQQIQLETAFNRAAARGQSLDQVTQQYTGPGSSGYYPASTFVGGRIRNPAEYDRFQRTVVDPVLAGSDVGTQRLGFAPTGNASGGVASRGIASGRYNQAGQIGGETYVQQERPQQLARLEALRRQGGGSFNVPSGAPTLTANDLSQDPAFSPQPAPTQVAQAGSQTLSDAAAEASDAGNPVIPTEIPKAPAAPSSQPAPQYAPLPSQEPIPQSQYVENVDPGPRPEQPKPLPPSDAMNYAARYKDNPDVSEGTRAHFKHIYDVEESYRKELEARATAKYTNDLAQWNQATNENQKRVYARPEAELKMLTDRTALEKTRADLADAYFKQGRPREQALEQADLDIANAKRKLLEPIYKESQGAFYQISPPGSPNAGTATPVPGGPPPQLTEQQQKAVQFAALKSDMDIVDKELNYGKILTDRTQAGLALLPAGIGREQTSQEYHTAADKLGGFAAAFLSLRSGQNVTPSEALRNAPLIMPMVGDTDKDLQEKARRRQLLIESTTAAAGPEARRVADEVYRNFTNNSAAAAGVPVHVATPDEAAKLPPGTVIVLPDGRRKTVPPRAQP